MSILMIFSSVEPSRVCLSDALAACNYLPQSREKIIAALFKALNSTNSELQEAGEACMRKVSPLPPQASFPFSYFCLFRTFFRCPAASNESCLKRSIQDGVKQAERKMNLAVMHRLISEDWLGLSY